MKSSFCLLNPIPGMKIQSRPPPRSRRNLTPRIKTSHHGSLVQAEDENSWEAVYKYKLRLKNHSQVEERSKLTSESNQPTYWTDSQTHDGSSSNHRSTGGVSSPYRNESPRSPSLEGKDFPEVPKKESESCKNDSFASIEKDGRSYWVITPHGGRQQAWGSTSPAIDTTLHVDSVHMPETLNSKSSSLDATADTDGGMIDFADKNSEAIADSQRMEQSLVLDTCETDAVQCKSSEVVDPGLSSFSEILNNEMNGNEFSQHGSNADSLPFKVDDQEKNDASFSLSLLPPPLPKSPSESWLSRTLPSVSSKKPSLSPQSSLGIQLHPRKQSFRPFSTDPKWETNVKPSKVSSRLVRFAEMTAKPASPQSET